MGADFLPEAEQERLAIVDPERLAAIIAAGTLCPTSLTFAAEHMGKAKDAALVVRTLTPLLSHESAYVREGALIGLWQHSDALPPDVVERVRRMADSDESPGVRAVAGDFCDDMAPRVDALTAPASAGPVVPMVATEVK